MQIHIDRFISHAAKVITMTFVVVITLYGCNGYKYLELTVVEPGDLQKSLQSTYNKVTDLRINGTMGPSDTEYLIELATNSDILTQLDFSNCDIKLPHHAFAGCTYIKSVIMPRFSMLAIPHQMFSGCTNLTQVQLPVACISIEENAFKNCASLSQIVLPSSLDNIKDGAFVGCTNLAEIYCMATIPPQCNSQCFSQTNPNVCLYVPKGCIDLYRKASGWNRIKNMAELKDSNMANDTNWKKH